MAADVVAYADGGGKVRRYRTRLLGFDKVIELHEELTRSFTQSMSQLIRYASINSMPGFITIEAGDVLQTTALEVAADKIVGIYVMRNPDKLRRLDDAAVH